MENNSDVLIIGGGIAGLTLAIKLAQQDASRTITVLSKHKPGESNSRYAQGGVAAVMDQKQDDFESHIADTLATGDGLCDPLVVKKVIEEGPIRLNEILDWGVEFDRKSSGMLDLGLEGGHSANRIIHAKDQTGHAIMQKLLVQVRKLPNVNTRWHTLVLDLIVENGKCIGAEYLTKDASTTAQISTSAVVLATGGIGQVYSKTTNPQIATGDGIAMAARAGARIQEMQFVQFHPTALNIDTGNTLSLISEAVRGYGAYLRNENGERFVLEVDERGELAPRDIVARSIYRESLKGAVFLDCTHLEADEFKSRFPYIYERCLSLGVDALTDQIPVCPAAHYLCGGIATSLDAKTSIEGLYAIGECARTGLHGANRLASNSLLEALVFAHWCYEDIITKQSAPVVAKEKVETDVEAGAVDDLKSELQSIMTKHAGVVRTSHGIREGLIQVDTLQLKMDKLPINWQSVELKNMADVSRLILQQSLEQKENKGVFYNPEFDHNE
ncbi:MAG: L-aspartate oxidase [Cyclobacteriaceae bacterium]